MSDLADLYPGFASEWINTSLGRIFARVGGKGPPLLLLHGFSETHVMWHRVAPQLADKFTLIIADLPGYGWSDMPESDALHMPYSKRAMAKAMVEAMEQLGHVHFALAGHDRGGRVSYRLALDHPGRLSRLAVLDILPTYNYWERMNRAYALKIYHWTFLAQPAPLPETLISSNGEFFLRFKMASQTKSKTLDAIVPRSRPRARDVRGLPRRRLFRLRPRQGRFRGRQEDHHSHAGAVGQRRRGASRRDTAGYVEAMGHERGWHAGGFRPLPHRGEPRRHRAGAARVLRRLNYAVATHTAVIARLDRAIQYSETVVVDR
jgi:pimeloyl-ACP methyl ester carboxylesterase